jgi:hypothetical protein
MTQDPTKFLEVQDLHTFLLCAVCGYNHVHPTSVQVNNKSRVVTIDGSDVIVAHLEDDDPHHPENYTTLSFNCERGCLFEVVLVSRKGYTMVSVSPVARSVEWLA